MKLNELADRPGARHARKRVGRGIGSGTGKTSARGQKGQGARAGIAIQTFEGGQMPLHRRLPMRGFTNPTRKSYVEINLGRLQAAVDAGTLDAKAKIDAAALIAAGVLRRAHDGLRVLADGVLKVALTIEAQGASRKAVETVEKLGGSLTVLGKKAEAEEAPKREAKAKPEAKAPKTQAAEAEAKPAETKAQTPKDKGAKEKAAKAKATKDAAPKEKAPKAKAVEGEAKSKAKSPKAKTSEES
jgi:large subunit ribosomal protein L15